MNKYAWSQVVTFYSTIICRRRSDYRSRGEYSLIITEPEANNCFSINTQVNIPKMKEKVL